jgi:integrase
VDEITHDEVAIWKDQREVTNKRGSEERISPKTLREDILLLHLIFKAAIKNGFASINPVQNIEFPRNVPIKKQGAVHDNILKEALRKFRREEFLPILALRNSGLRLGELFRVEIEDINFETRLIRVRSVQK